jgi:hypothetical protein
VNDFKFKDCRDCRFVGNGDKSAECKDCHSGENFEEFYPDTVDLMEYDDGEYE